MNQWLVLVLLSAITGVFSGLLIRGSTAVLVGAVLPFLGLVAWVVYAECFVKSSALWVLSIFFGGPVAASVGFAAAAIIFVTRRVK
jgi:hypothetical protein